MSARFFDERAGMDLGLIGLGRMGARMAERLVRGGHRVVGFDGNAAARDAAASVGIEVVAALEDLASALAPPRTFWMMVPAGQPTDDVLAQLLALASAGDAIVDGGNSNYQHTLRRAELAATKSVHYIDSGTSGGIWGLDNGYSLMIGGDENAVAGLRPIFETLAPAPDKGWGRVGPVGAGHYAKMVHNGIEYGLMQAYAEGFSVLRHKTDFAFDVHQIAEIWQHGSVVRSWLLDLIADALNENPSMAGIAPRVDDSGEGRWTVADAMELGVPAPVMTAALIERLRSRDVDSFSDKLVAAMRAGFGGHAVAKE